MILTTNNSVPSPQEIENLVLSHSNEFEILRDKKVLIIGGTGLIGTWILRAILRANDYYHLNCSVIITGRRSLYESLHNITYIPVDFMSDTFPEKILEYSADVLIFAATSTNVADTENFQAVDIQLKNIDSILTQIVKKQSGIRIINLSSGAVYGLEARRNHFISELNNVDLEYCTNDPYAGIKLGVEKIVESLTQISTSQGVNLRLFSFYGHGLPLNQHFVIGNFIRSALTEKRITILGNSESTRGYLHFGDLVINILKAISIRDLHTVNLGSVTPMRIKDLASCVKEAAKDKSIQIDFLGESEPPNHYVPYPSELFRSYEFIESYDFEKSLANWVGIIRDGISN
jgi:nucleoside-diphosphate-sugar epimerase